MQFHLRVLDRSRSRWVGITCSLLSCSFVGDSLNDQRFDDSQRDLYSSVWKLKLVTLPRSFTENCASDTVQRGRRRLLMTVLQIDQFLLPRCIKAKATNPRTASCRFPLSDPVCVGNVCKTPKNARDIRVTLVINHIPSFKVPNFCRW